VRLRAEPGYSSRILLSPELRLALSPAETYQRLVHERPTGTGWRAFGRAAFFMLVFSAAVAMTATGHITLPLLFHIGLSWIILVVWQAMSGAAIILPARSRRVSVARAFELLFLAHVPWSLYALTMTALAVSEANVPILVVALTGVAPIAWTSVVVAGFCRTVLGATAAGARRLTFVHQLVIWSGTLAFLWFAVGGWTPILQTVGL
jgi:hypothetical protein